jgi:hypothetical protein
MPIFTLRMLPKWGYAKSQYLQIFERVPKLAEDASKAGFWIWIDLSINPNPEL